MPLLHLKNVSIAFGVHALLDHADFQIDAGERVGLIGRNGEGKSTLLKIIAGIQATDSGEVWRAPSLRLAVLEQAPELPQGASIYDAVADGLGEVGHAIAGYHHLLLEIGHGASDKKLAELGRLQQWLEAHEGWSLQQRVETVLSRLSLPGEAPVAGLSGGWQRRVTLARALVCGPDVLLLDEPTNHLDLETIAWLEEQLLQFRGALLFVTHDRAFLQKLATRIVDLDRGQLVSWPGGYADYLDKKAAALEEEARHNALFDKKLAQEEVWIRQGIKARRTRNEGRVRALKKLREERSARRTQQGRARLELEQAESSGKIVIDAKNVMFSYDGQPVIRDFSTTIQRGDRVGLIGPNGAGKTTLLRLLLGELEAQSGSVRQGTRLEIAYFDQLRAQLDPDQTLADAVGNGSDYLTVGGRRVHILGYLGDFLFSPARARSPIRSLSGGERNRALLARLFSQPANLLVMDEPTNDLDLETLELLEELLANYEGTLLLVSHDRAFLDNVVTSSLVFEGDGVVAEYVGGYSDWQLQRTAPRSEPAAPKPPAAEAAPQPAAPAPRKKLGYKEQRELEQLPARIAELENRQTELNALINSDGFFQQDREKVQKKLEERKCLEHELGTAYARWDELESLAG